MFNFRFILGFATLAFFISLLAGILGGLPFGIILLRSLIGSTAFAFLGFGASWIIQRFIPNLLDTGGGTDREPAPVSIDDSIKDNRVYLSNNFAGKGVFSLLSINIDKITKAPGIEGCEVTIKKL